MNRIKFLTAALVAGIGIAAPLLILPLTGCVGYVQGDDGPVVMEPDLFWYGGYDDGWDARGYGGRGEESRGFGGRMGRGERR